MEIHSKQFKYLISQFFTFLNGYRVVLIKDTFSLPLGSCFSWGNSGSRRSCFLHKAPDGNCWFYWVVVAIVYVKHRLGKRS